MQHACIPPRKNQHSGAASKRRAADAGQLSSPAALAEQPQQQSPPHTQARRVALQRALTESGKLSRSHLARCIRSAMNDAS